MKIVPIALSGGSVNVLKAIYDKRDWILNISCHGEEHTLTLRGEKELTISDHSPQEINDEKVMADLAGDPGSACPCVGVKIWLSGGIYMIDIVP